MSFTSHRPVTAAQRGMTTQDFSSVTAKRPVRSLVVIKKQRAGRSNQGKITTRQRGGGRKRFLRVVNYRLQPGSRATIEHIEYDPNRSARIARIKDQSGTYHYVIAPQGAVVGQLIVAGEDAPIETGNRLPLSVIPVGSMIHAIELKAGGGAQLVRSAGASAQLVAREGEYAQVRLPSGEVRSVHVSCMAHMGGVGNEQHQNIKLGKAGRTRRMGRRPQVRGVVMNPVDHPHGGGEGRGKGGSDPRTPWGKKTLGYKTRRRKVTTKFIVKSRHETKRK